jgi:hypothetical protein
VIYFSLIAIGFVCDGLIIHFLLGKSLFILNYPLLFFFNGVIMMLLALIGLRNTLFLDKIPILSWMAGLGLVFVFCILKISSLVYVVVDPLRYIEFIYPPLAIISATGFLVLTGNLGQKYRATLLALICLVSLVVAFPSTVFWGQVYPPSDIRHDLRALVISHPDSEIMALDHLREAGARGVLHTDLYVGYAALQLENLTIDDYQRIDPARIWGEGDFVLLTDRMTKYAEFGEWLLAARSPLKNEEMSGIEENLSRVYDNGDAWIYRG